jgi:type II restriction enzyme
LLGSIGLNKEFDIWIPFSDRSKLDWTIASPFMMRNVLYGFEQFVGTLSEIDVIWLKRGSNEIKALFEVEHSTPIYSGLLRFNDVHLAVPTLNARYSIVANSERRSVFVKQLNRPTFRLSGLGDACNFLEYADVYNWYERLVRS